METRTPSSIFLRIYRWRPRTPFYYGWLVLGVAALGTYASTGFSQLVMGGIQTLIFDEMGWDRSTIALAVTVATWSSGLLTPFIGRAADRYGPRGMMPFAALVIAIAYFGLAGIQQVWHFYAAFIIGRAIANPILVGVVPRTAAVNFFHRKRNLALGITSMARPFGGAINIQLIVLVARVLSWRAGVRFLGVFGLVMIVPLWFVMRRRPEDIGLQPDGDAATTDVAPLADEGAPEISRRPPVRPRGDWAPSEAVLTSAFWFIVGAQVLEVLTSGAVGFQVVPYMKDAGATLTLATLALSGNSLLGALTNPFLGYLSDRFTPKSMALVVTGATGLMSILFLFVGSPASIFWVVIIWGTFSGGQGILMNMMMAQFYGRSSYGAITGLIGPLQTGALGLGPIFGAMLFTWTGSYTALFVWGVVAYAVALSFVFAAHAPRRQDAVTRGSTTASN